MHTYEARNSDCLQSISKAMRPIAQTLREFVRIQEEEEGVQVQGQAQELEGRVDVLNDTLDKVQHAATTIPYTRRRATPVQPSTRPTETLTLGNLKETAKRTTTTWREVSRKQVELDPDRQLEEEMDAALAGMQESSGDMEVDPLGSALLGDSPPRDAANEDRATTPRGGRTNRSANRDPSSASQRKLTRCRPNRKSPANLLVPEPTDS